MFNASQKPVETSACSSNKYQLAWKNKEKFDAFTAYIQTSALGNIESRSWDIFQLAYEATQNSLVPAFEKLLAIDHTFGFQPLPHQLKTAQRVVSELRGRAILADEVGLGKTIEAGLILKEYLLRGLAKKVLLLVPTSLVLQWTRELAEKFRIQSVAQRRVDDWQADIIVASLDTAKREPHRSLILAETWDMIIIDEAHKLKNRKTKNWDTINRITSKYMLLLTATPIQNQLDELHALITLLRPGQLGKKEDFFKQHVSQKRIAKNPAELKNSVKEVMIRNRREDGNTQLPPRHVKIWSLDLNPQERDFYQAVQDYMKREYQYRTEKHISTLPILTLLREICSSPYAAMISIEKMMKRSNTFMSQEEAMHLLELGGRIQTYTKAEKVLSLLRTMQNSKCVIFTEYRATQDYLLYRLKKEGIPAVSFRGGFKKSKKDWMQDLFEHRAQILVATETGGEGINLQFCNYMINLDLPWNPMRLEQRIGRIHRLGQTKPCYIHHLTTYGTLEEHIVKLLHEKIHMFQTVIGQTDTILSKNPQWEKKLLEIAMTSQNDREMQEQLQLMNSSIPTKES